MKNVVLFLLISFSVFSQEIHIESKMNETKFENALKNFEGYTYYSFDFVTAETSSLHIEIIEKEYVNGKLVKEISCFNSNKMPVDTSNERIPFTILAKSNSDINYRIQYQFYDFINLYRNHDLKREDRYAFKIFINEAQKFTFNQKYLFSAIVKPIKIDENTFRNCDFAKEMDKYDQWYEIFGIDRYFIYEIKFY
ncbi:hypothetical protein [Paenimyroides aestuarii]|uniref:Uncharacterized protein n=1 Tax=Paenimyroides aestuarii TaxID=2968490 RepID=A0ABY5NTW8_9FLAO|nr:hypothetical protein [Paenimyroides aestuarii]UUV22027.1 hypothetical protein NPX36_03000 [Paenimyroides aestuarii]